jgi:SAM-dependent methyltransferase
MAGAGLKVLSIIYRGSAVTCPICGRGFKKFLPYGRINPRENALCPSCLSLERHRLIWLYLQKTTDVLTSKKKILHIAPEVCFMKPLEKIHQADYITGDIESPLAKVKMDIHQIPFDDNQFDLVLCNHVLEHVNNDILAMREITRVLKQGGFAILQVPFFPPLPDETIEDLTITDPRERERLFGQDDHVRKFGKDYAQRINLAGLAAVEDRFIYSLSADERKRYGLAEGEIIYKGVKQA